LAFDDFPMIKLEVVFFGEDDHRGKNTNSELGMVVPRCTQEAVYYHPSTQEAEAGELRV
jgi:hypothetical protein